MKTVKQIKIFIAHPEDIVDELSSIQLITDEINKTSGKQNSYHLDLLNWKTDTYTQVGTDAEEVILNQLEGEYDILVGLLWRIIGTPTKRDKSGTIEEINRSVSNKEKERLIYFKTTPPDNLNKIDIDQLSKINSFKKELSLKGVLYKEFNTITSFESQFRINLSNMIVDQFINIEKESTEIIVNTSNDEKYSSITNLINEVENKDESALEVDIVEVTLKSTSSLDKITASIESITISLTDLGTNITKRTKELNKFNNIKDNRLRISKVSTTANLLANELDEFNNHINNELPNFSKNFVAVGKTYSNIVLAASAYDSEVAIGMKETAITFRDAVEISNEGCANLLREIMKWPPVNLKFNKSKRETELTLKNLTKEMLEGLILLNEAVISMPNNN